MFLSIAFMSTVGTWSNSRDFDVFSWFSEVVSRLWVVDRVAEVDSVLLLSMLFDGRGLLLPFVLDWREDSLGLG